MTMRGRSLIGLAVLALALVAAPFLAPNSYYLDIVIRMCINAVIVLSLNLLIGYAGQISLGHAGFVGLGAYASAVLPSHFGWHPLLALAAGAAGTGLLALLVARPILRLKGHYLAMATLGFGIIIYRIALASEYFGEADGISEVPAFLLPFGLEVSGSFSARVENYYIAWGLLLIGMILLKNLIDSRVGRALRSIHGSPEAAESTGVDTARSKLQVFVLSAVFAAVAGVFLTHYNGGIGPSEAGVMKSGVSSTRVR